MDADLSDELAGVFEGALSMVLQGVPLADALRDGGQSSGFPGIFDSIGDSIRADRPLAEALGQHKTVFDAVILEMALNGFLGGGAPFLRRSSAYLRTRARCLRSPRPGGPARAAVAAVAYLADDGFPLIAAVVAAGAAASSAQVRAQARDVARALLAEAPLPRQCEGCPHLGAAIELGSALGCIDLTLLAAVETSFDDAPAPGPPAMAVRLLELLPPRLREAPEIRAFVTQLCGARLDLMTDLAQRRPRGSDAEPA